MQLYSRLFACGIAFGLLLGCQHNVPQPITAANPPTDVQREMATLAFLSYLGDTLPASGAEEKVTKCLEEALEKQDINRWKLAWGPAVYHFSISDLDDNMMYVVRDTTNPAHLAVVIRGTNFSAFLDWLVEDFDVVDQVAWITSTSVGRQPKGQPKISKGTSEGLHILQEMKPTGGPAPNQTLLQFLSNASSSGLQIDVTGHSLGGALAPALALWLAENLGEKAKISVYTLAGPTSGNADFAAYYESVLGNSTQRLWNPFDVVPLAWNHESMGRMADLYEPLTRANPVERGLLDGLRSLVKDKGYAQIDPSQTSLSGAVSTDLGKKVDWLTEAGWQHHCGYQCALGISIPTKVQGCPSHLDKFLCAVCPAGLGPGLPVDLGQKVAQIVDKHASPLIYQSGTPAANQAPGGIVGVYIDGKSLYFPYGRIDEQGTPPTKDTIFGLGSVTKTFTTSILGQRPELFQQSVTAGPLPPGYRLQPEEAPVTFEQLATFTGGIKPSDPDDCGAHGLPPCDQKLFVEFINGITPPDGKLPAPNVYSNSSIGFVGQILMHRDGYQHFGAEHANEWYNKNLFSHIGMYHTSHPPKTDAQHPLSQAYALERGAYTRIEYDPWAPWGTAGRMFSTAEDMIHFVQANVGVNRIDGKPVPENVLAGMRQALKPRTAGPRSDLRQAFAWVVWPEEDLPVKSRIHGKDGGLAGVSAYVSVNPDLEYGIVILTNMAHVHAQDAAIAIMKALQPLAGRTKQSRKTGTIAANEAGSASTIAKQQ